MADKTSSPSSDRTPMMPVSGWPMPLLYPFSAKDVVALLGQLGLALAAMLTFWRKPRPTAAGDGAPPPAGPAASLTPSPISGRGGEASSPAYGNRALGTTLHFKFLHAASFVIILPVIAAVRLLPSHWHDRHDQSVFVETNHAVLTALEFAFMA